ncbi:hypothetical protein, partial [Enterococcus casseliflavus]|uniref:hypothetical protein n=1 Tax=Enterococcus casseliflavus TaxID=37734 RepID=UPI003D0A7194
LTSSFVQVLGVDPGEEPELPDARMRVILGDALGEPGDTVEVPVFASAALHSLTLRLALELDPRALAVDEVAVETWSSLQGDFVERIVV